MAEWDATYINGLPDSAFAIVLPGGTKDSDGRTVPRNLRRLPYRDDSGAVDLPHLRNALSRLPQTDLSPAQQSEARRVLEHAATVHGVGDRSAPSSSRLPASSIDVPDGVTLRTVEFELSLRTGAAGDGRTLVGRLVPYGLTSEVADPDAHGRPGRPYRERFVRGAFERQLRSGQHRQVALFPQHVRENDRLPLARADRLFDEADGLFGSFPMPHTTAADDALELVRSGVVTGLSVGFRLLDGSGSRRASDGVIERHRAHVDHVALTHSPAYAGAEVVALRTVGDPAEHPAGSGRPLATWRREADRLRRVLD